MENNYNNNFNSGSPYSYNQTNQQTGDGTNTSWSSQVNGNTSQGYSQGTQYGQENAYYSQGTQYGQGNAYYSQGTQPYGQNQQKKKRKEKVKKEIALDIAKQEKEIKERAVKEAKKVFSEKYIMYFESNLQSAAAMIAESYYKTAKQNIVIYVANHNLELINSIQERKGKLEELKQIRENGDEELRERLDVGKVYINNIEECIN